MKSPKTIKYKILKREYVNQSPTYRAKYKWWIFWIYLKKYGLNGYSITRENSLENIKLAIHSDLDARRNAQKNYEVIEYLEFTI